jgi:beta-galactosidase
MNQPFRIGVAYYPDYIPEVSIDGITSEEQLKRDFERMQRDRISYIRVGEFSWSFVEPKRGEFFAQRFLRCLDLAQESEIEVIFCTPTATPPKWLIDEFPDILPITREGKRIPFGSRRHYDPCNPDYQRECARITQAYGRAFGNHPAVVGWQIDNEFGCHSSTYSFTEHSKTKFHDWLRRKYKGDLERLNDDWFTSFWSQRYSEFEQIELPFASWADQNPHLELDFRRFSNAIWSEFQKIQCDIIRSNSPNRFITHNFMSLFTELCPWKLSVDLDIAGFDHYQMENDPSPISSHWQFCLMHSLKRKPFIVLEQQPLQVNWQPTNRRFAYDWLLLWGVQSYFLGASAMLYFSWQRMYGGAEQYHDGVVPHDTRVKQSWQERIIKAKLDLVDHIFQSFELKEPLTSNKSILIIHDFESQWSHEITPQSQQYQTRKELDGITQLFAQSALGIDFAERICAEIRAYQCVVLPGYAFELTDDERALLLSFISSGGTVLSLPRTAMKLRNNQMSRFPAAFLDQNDFHLEDYGAMLENEGETVTLHSSATQVQAVRWAEKLVLNNGKWKEVASFSDGLYAGSPAAIKFECEGGGRWLHLAFCADGSFALQDWILNELGLGSVARVRSGDVQLVSVSSGDRDLLAALNFGFEDAEVICSGSIKGLVFSLTDHQQLETKVAASDESFRMPPRSVACFSLTQNR